MKADFEDKAKEHVRIADEANTSSFESDITKEFYRIQPVVVLATTTAETSWDGPQKGDTEIEDLELITVVK